LRVFCIEIETLEVVDGIIDRYLLLQDAHAGGPRARSA